MILYFLRYIICIIFITILPAQALCKETLTNSHSEGKKASGKAKNSPAPTWVNREEGMLESHPPTEIPVDIPFIDEKGQNHSFEEFYGQVVLVNFWATWCTPCTQEMPALSKLQKDFKRKNFKVVAISGDFKGVDVVKEFYDANGITNLPIYLDPKNTLSKAFGISGFPTSILINADGYEIARILGSDINWESDDFRDFIISHTDHKIYNAPEKTPQTPSLTPSTSTENSDTEKDTSSSSLMVPVIQKKKGESEESSAQKEAEKDKENVKEKTSASIDDDVVPANAITHQPDKTASEKLPTIIPVSKPDLSDPALRRPVNQPN